MSKDYCYSNWRDDFKALEIETINLIEPEPIVSEQKKDPCWSGFKQYGMKKKGNKLVPNCVKEEEINEIHRQAHTPHEVPSGRNLKKLVSKASKRIDTDADGDVDHNDKAKGELGEFIPGVGNKRLYSTTGTKTAKESFSNWREELGEDWQKVNTINGYYATESQQSLHIGRMLSQASNKDYAASKEKDPSKREKLETQARTIRTTVDMDSFKKRKSKVKPQRAGVQEGFLNWREDLGEDWQKVNKQDKTDGMSPDAVKEYRRENPGSKLKTAVTGDPKPGSKDAKRRKSFCSRSKGQQDMHNIDCSKDPDKAICKARRRWKC